MPLRKQAQKGATQCTQWYCMCPFAVIKPRQRAGLKASKISTKAFEIEVDSRIDIHIPKYPGIAREPASVPRPRLRPTRMGENAGPNTLACLGSRPTPNAMKIRA